MMNSDQEKLASKASRNFSNPSIVFQTKELSLGGCVISLWRTLFYVIYCIILEVS